MHFEVKILGLDREYLLKKKTYLGFLELIYVLNRQIYVLSRQTLLSTVNQVLFATTLLRN